MGPRKKQEFLSLDAVPFSKAGTCRKSTRDVQEVERGSQVRDAEEKKGLEKDFLGKSSFIKLSKRPK